MENLARQLWDLPVQWLLPEREALGVRNHYDATRLGPDRWAAILGARGLFPGKTLVVVSVGTAQVVDALTAAGDFLGGSHSARLSVNENGAGWRYGAFTACIRSMGSVSCCDGRCH